VADESDNHHVPYIELFNFKKKEKKQQQQKPSRDYGIA